MIPEHVVYQGTEILTDDDGWLICAMQDGVDVTEEVYAASVINGRISLWWLRGSPHAPERPRGPGRRPSLLARLFRRGAP